MERPPATPSFPGSWPRPEIARLEGRYVEVSRLDPGRDVGDLYSLSHGTPEYEALWTYLFPAPFPSQDAMYAWLASIQKSQDPLYYSVLSKALGRRVGMISILNIVPEAGRAELGNIWYSPKVQKSQVNTETTYLFLRHLFDDLKYRRVEWKCNSQNEPSRKAALRMGFRYEGLFRQHMVVKGLNRDTAWFAIIDREWPELRANFEKYLSSEGVSLSALNGQPSTGIRGA
jgi:RimJ/RimL family protein N-acetyltransferase